jgi:hypothetical protein
MDKDKINAKHQDKVKDKDRTTYWGTDSSEAASTPASPARGGYMTGGCGRDRKRNKKGQTPARVGGGGRGGGGGSASDFFKPKSSKKRKAIDNQRSAFSSEHDHGSGSEPYAKSTLTKRPQRTATHCGNASCAQDGTRSCGACNKIKYCSRVCQEQHWEEGGHRKACLRGGKANKQLSAAAIVKATQDHDRTIRREQRLKRAHQDKGASPKESQARGRSRSRNQRRGRSRSQSRSSSSSSGSPCPEAIASSPNDFRVEATSEEEYSEHGHP